MKQNNDADWMVKGDRLTKYLQVCQKAATDPETFKVFKSLPEYTYILEHLDTNVAWNYLHKIKQETPELLELRKFYTNDKYGSPKKYWFGDTHASPTTIQYIGVLNNLITNFSILDDWKICEIGGGYGGQCKIIQDLIKVQQYTIIDLPGVTQLQELYVSLFGYKLETFTPDNYPVRKYDLVISNYALSEINEPLRTKYIQDILRNGKHGYITCNTPMDMELLHKVVSPHIRILPDIAGDCETNYILIW